MDMIKLRVSQLEALGHTHEAIGKMPLAALHKTPTSFLDKNKASAFLRALLNLVGCDERWLEAQAAQMYAAAAAAGNSEDLEVCAHTLRSTIATFACNGGVEAEAVDAFLGHKNDVNRKKDYASWAVAQALSSKLERCIYLGSLCKTTNPAYAPVMAKEGQRYVLDGNMKYRFEAKRDIYATFDLQNLHPGSVLKIRMPKQKGEEPFWVRTAPNDMAKIGTVAILQPLSDEDEVEKWIAEAHEINLDALILKYGETI